MRDRPSAAELLQIARETLLRELLSQFPETRRYTALMVANAIAIAARETETRDADLQQALGQLAALYGEAIAAHAGEAAEAQLARLNARLAGDIRAGVFDDDPKIAALLLEDVCARLRVSNPKYLKAAGLGDE